MGLFKNWKPKTIFGKILKGAGSVIAPVLGVVTGIGAITGIAKGVGVLSGVGTAIKTTATIGGKTVTGVKKVLDKVGGAAVNLVTGTTKEERLQVLEQKTIVRDQNDKLQQVDRLIKAGATKVAAMAKVGLNFTETAAISDALEKPDVIGGNKPDVEKPDVMTWVKDNPVLIGVGAIAAILLLPNLFKTRRR